MIAGAVFISETNTNGTDDGRKDMLLHNIRKDATGNATWGCMWEKGTFNKCEDIDAVLVCKGKNKQQVEMQSRVTAYWPDG